jgi:predicted ATPase/GAF domain-containing protein
MLALDGYSLKPLTRTHEELHLYRGTRLADQAAVLVQVAARSSQATQARLEHEYDLREELHIDWAVQPLGLMKLATNLILVETDPGGELLEKLLGPALPVPLFLRLAIGITRAVVSLHQQELVHKDLQPAHILIDVASGKTHLLGFGNASRIPRAHQDLIPLEVITSNLAYIAPELTGRVNRSIDSRSDLYTLGVVFYQMLTGVLPFTAVDAIGWVHSHIARQPLPVTERVPTMPAMLSAMVLKLLEKNAEERYQTAGGLLADLQHCMVQLARTGRIDEFALARHDASGRLIVPEKLYGREQARQVLLDAVDQVLASGTFELVLVSGYSGIGKSSLVHELLQVLVQPRARFITSKFDQHKRDIPYITLAQAFQILVRQMLGQSRAALDDWRDAILHAVGSNGQLLLDLIPELQFVIGPQPATLDLPPTEAQNRFQTVFTQFLSVCASEEHPLIVFLDDWQWMDVASMRLISDLLTTIHLRYFLLIGAYRDNEVAPTDPLMITLDGLRQHQVLINQIVLAPLQRADVAHLLTDTLHAAPEQVGPLTDLVYEKTAGNPFFTTQFLNRLADERLLSFNFEQRLWEWDLARIEQQGFSQNVIDLMIAKLQRLPRDCLDAVKLLACLGNGAEVRTLAKVCDQTMAVTEADLWPAVKIGLLVQHHTSYQLAHDRVQEAAYSLTAPELRPQVHLNIARLLVAHLSESEIEEDIFDIVSQFNLGLALIDQASERAQVAHFNFLAGKKAKDAVAYTAARSYLRAALQLQNPDAWESDYANSFQLVLSLSECEYLTGHFEQADALFQLLRQHAHSNVDRAKVAMLCSDLYQLSGKFDLAVDVGLEALQLFGVRFPEQEAEINAAFVQEMAEIETRLAGRQAADLIHLPSATDPDIQMAIAIFADLASPVHQIRPQLFLLLATKTMNYILQHGNANGASMAYTCYAVILTGSGKIDQAFQFSEMALAVSQKFHDTKRAGIFEYCHGVFIHSWSKSMNANLPLLEHAFVSCVDVGNFFWAGYCTFAIPWFTFDKGAKLDEVRRVIKKYMDFAIHSHNQVAAQMDVLLLQACSCLQGNTLGLISFSDDKVQESEVLAVFSKACYHSGTCTFYILKQIVAVVFGQVSAGMQAAEQALPLLDAVRATMLENSHVFFHALSASAAYFDKALASNGTADQEALRCSSLRRIVADAAEKLAVWAQYCPENFANRHSLILAELARIDGQPLQAMDYYDAAIRFAHESGFVQNEAIANERAAQFFFARGSDKIAHTYLREARLAYLRWGAQAKVAQLDRRYPSLHSRRSDGASRNAAQVTTRAEHLDLMSVIKASQAVSADIVLDHLIEALLRILLEHAGADRGILLLPHNGQLQIAAVAQAVDEKIQVLVHPPTQDNALPQMVLNYVARALDKVLLDDASSAHPYATDPYWQDNPVKSSLCLPLIKQANLVGVMYLENRLVPGVFNHGRISVIELLASQAAISIENATLFMNLAREQSTIRELNANLEQRVAERTAELQRTLLEQQAILDNAQIGISIVRERRILRCNAGQEMMMGYGPGELVGRSSRILFPSEEAILVWRIGAPTNYFGR